MIGQKKLLNSIQEQIIEDKFPRFSIIVGQKGSGKKTLADMIPSFFEGTDYTYTLPDVKVETIRKMIEDAYKVNTRTFYIIPDADTMSVAAKNAILKVTEEPPNNAYFVMTLCDVAQTLPTIRSRGTIFRMDNYSTEEIYEYAKSEDDELDIKSLGIIIDIVETPLEVQMLLKYGVTAFSDYVKSVVDNVAEVSGANSFKIADKLAMKDEEDKFDLRLFWKAFMAECSYRMLESKSEDTLHYADGIMITTKYLQELNITGINKHMTFDNWLLDLRQAW